MKIPEEQSRYEIIIDKIIKTIMNEDLSPIDMAREVYADVELSLRKDSYKINKEVLESVRARCAETAHVASFNLQRLVKRAVLRTNIDDLIPDGGSDGWISASEPPQSDRTVTICSTNGYMGNGSYEDKMWQIHGIGWADNITHWRELPTPPQTVKK